jgi:hypothetical protein
MMQKDLNVHQALWMVRKMGGDNSHFGHLEIFLIQMNDTGITSHPEILPGEWDQSFVEENSLDGCSTLSREVCPRVTNPGHPESFWITEVVLHRIQIFGGQALVIQRRQFSE